MTISEVSNWPQQQEVKDLPATHTWLGVPLIYQDSVMGLISLSREASDAYNDIEVKFVAALADQTAIALANTYFSYQLAYFKENLEDVLEERTSDLQVAYIKLEHLLGVNVKFISVASHELRTPLTVLRGYSDMLLNDPKIKKNPNHLQLVSNLQAGAIRLSEIVTDLIDMARIDSQTLQLYPQPLSPVKLIQRVCQTFEQPLRQRNLTLKLEFPPTLPLIEADPDILQKVFLHLLGNAIKYTPDGGVITLTGRILPDKANSAGGDGIEIVISDTGIGIDRGHHKLIFTKFHRIGDPALHSTGKTKFKGCGLGLGLALAQGFVAAHQGKIWVESRAYDEVALWGSDFHIILPRHQERQADREEASF